VPGHRRDRGARGGTDFHFAGVTLLTRPVGCQDAVDCGEKLKKIVDKRKKTRSKAQKIVLELKKTCRKMGYIPRTRHKKKKCEKKKLKERGRCTTWANGGKKGPSRQSPCERLTTNFLGNKKEKTRLRQNCKSKKKKKKEDRTGEVRKTKRKKE